MSKPRPGKTAPKSGMFLAWGKPKDTRMVTFKAAGWHVVYWDSIDGAFCLSGATYEGPFIKPKYWMKIPKPPAVSIG